MFRSMYVPTNTITDKYTLHTNARLLWRSLLRLGLCLCTLMQYFTRHPATVHHNEKVVVSGAKDVGIDSTSP